MCGEMVQNSTTYLKTFEKLLCLSFTELEMLTKMLPEIIEDISVLETKIPYQYTHNEETGIILDLK